MVVRNDNLQDLLIGKFTFGQWSIVCEANPTDALARPNEQIRGGLYHLNDWRCSDFHRPFIGTLLVVHNDVTLAATQ